MGYLTDTLINVISYSFKIQLDLIAVVIGYFLIVIFICLIYLIPTFIAHNRKHHNTLAIFLTNLLLGFTIIGWIAALIWSVTKPPQNNGKSDG
ncbi:MAG: superinfection immunity protein [Gammaproteobacteria bacterium]|nr:superinfection immunity protein [Gammaproteobacteria bacterium]